MKNNILSIILNGFQLVSIKLVLKNPLKDVGFVKINVTKSGVAYN